MKIAITGCGKVGTTLADKLSKENDVIVIDRNEDNLRYVSDGMDVMCVCGDAASAETLSGAGVASCDIFIAMTDSDETNIISCHLAKKLGVEKTIARVRNSNLYKTVELIREDIGLSLMINPDLDAAREIFRTLRFKDASQVETFAKGRTEIITLQVRQDSPISNIKIKNLRSKTKTNVFACGIKREGKIFIPNGDTDILPGDSLSIVAIGKDSYNFFKKIGYETGRVKNLTIIGGGRLGFYLAKLCTENGIPVRIIDKDEKVCARLTQQLPNAEVLCGDGMDTRFLEEEDILSAASVALLTGEDPVNIMISMYLHENAPDCKVIAKIKKSDFEEMLFNLGTGNIFNPKYIAADHVSRYVQAVGDVIENEIQSITHILDNKVAALEFLLGENAPNIGIPLKDINFKKNVLVCNIYRKGKVFIPVGNDTLEPGDDVLIITTNESITAFADIFA